MEYGLTWNGGIIFFFLVKKNGGIIKEGDLKNYNFNYGNLLRKMDSF